MSDSNYPNTGHPPDCTLPPDARDSPTATPEPTATGLPQQQSNTGYGQQQQQLGYGNTGYDPYGQPQQQPYPGAGYPQQPQYGFNLGPQQAGYPRQHQQYPQQGGYPPQQQQHPQPGPPMGLQFGGFFPKQGYEQRDHESKNSNLSPQNLENPILMQNPTHQMENHRPVALMSSNSQGLQSVNVAQMYGGGSDQHGDLASLFREVMGGVAATVQAAMLPVTIQLGQQSADMEEIRRDHRSLMKLLLHQSQFNSGHPPYGSAAAALESSLSLENTRDKSAARSPVIVQHPAPEDVDLYNKEESSNVVNMEALQSDPNGRSKRCRVIETTGDDVDAECTLPPPKKASAMSVRPTEIRMENETPIQWPDDMPQRKCETAADYYRRTGKRHPRRYNVNVTERQVAEMEANKPNMIKFMMDAGKSAVQARGAGFGELGVAEQQQETPLDCDNDRNVSVIEYEAGEGTESRNTRNDMEPETDDQKSSEDLYEEGREFDGNQHRRLKHGDEEIENVETEQKMLNAVVDTIIEGGESDGNQHRRLKHGDEEIENVETEQKMLNAVVDTVMEGGEAKAKKVTDNGGSSTQEKVNPENMDSEMHYDDDCEVYYDAPEFPDNSGFEIDMDGPGGAQPTMNTGSGVDTSVASEPADTLRPSMSGIISSTESEFGDDGFGEEGSEKSVVTEMSILLSEGTRFDAQTVYKKNKKKMMKITHKPMAKPNATRRVTTQSKNELCSAVVLKRGQTEANEIAGKFHEKLLQVLPAPTRKPPIPRGFCGVTLINVDLPDGKRENCVSWLLEFLDGIGIVILAQNICQIRSNRQVHNGFYSVTAYLDQKVVKSLFKDSTVKSVFKYNQTYRTYEWHFIAMSLCDVNRLALTKYLVRRSERIGENGQVTNGGLLIFEQSGAVTKFTTPKSIFRGFGAALQQPLPGESVATCQKQFRQMFKKFI